MLLSSPPPPCGVIKTRERTQQRTTSFVGVALNYNVLLGKRSAFNYFSHNNYPRPPPPPCAACYRRRHLVQLRSGAVALLHSIVLILSSRAASRISSPTPGYCPLLYILSGGAGAAADEI